MSKEEGARLYAKLKSDPDIQKVIDIEVAAAEALAALDRDKLNALTETSVYWATRAGTAEGRVKALEEALSHIEATSCCSDDAAKARAALEGADR